MAKVSVISRTQRVIEMEKLELAKLIGNNIKRLRKEKGISQAELGRLCFKDKQAIEKIENGKVNATAYTLYQISEALEVDVKEFLNFNNR